MARNKNKARKMQHHDVLDQALAAVNEGHDPHINGAKDLGVMTVTDPFDGEPRKKIIALRNDPLGHMHVKGYVDDVQLKAGRAYQRDYGQAEIGGARGIDPAVDKVDGGKFSEPDTDTRLAAQDELERIHAALGEYGRDLVGFVLGQNVQLAMVAQMWGLMAHHDYRALRRRFIECLDTIAIKKGYAPARPAIGPRRKRDHYDDLVQHSNNPLLHLAVMRAK